MVTSDSNSGEILQLFLKIGLDERTAQNAIVNGKVSSNLTDVIREAGVEDGCIKSVGNLLYMVATKYPANALKHRPFLLQYIISSKIKNPNQLEKALSFLSNTGPESLEVDDFEESCGIGVEVSVGDIKTAVDEVVNENMDAILAQRYRINAGNLYGQVRKLQPWADAKVVKEIMDTKLHELLGEKTAADEEKPVKKKKRKASESGGKSY